MDARKDTDAPGPAGLSRGGGFNVVDHFSGGSQPATDGLGIVLAH